MIDTRNEEKKKVHRTFISVSYLGHFIFFKFQSCLQESLLSDASFDSWKLPLKTSEQLKCQEFVRPGGNTLFLSKWRTILLLKVSEELKYCFKFPEINLCSWALHWTWEMLRLYLILRPWLCSFLCLFYGSG